MKSQCVYKCRLNKARTHCEGCGRRIEEIREAGLNTKRLEHDNLKRKSEASDRGTL
jgi:predicted Fe-S protein YdhL (DUF1289 family)